jgi:pyruvate dehydrogenase E1 component alpha subunit
MNHIELYRSLLFQMMRIRQTQERISQLYGEQEMRCPVHLCTGQEAVPVGICSNLNPTDHVFSFHRSHGHYLAKGGDMNRLFAELYGKATGVAGGKGGSMHLVDTNAGFLGSTSIIAGTIPVAVGSALSAVMQRKERVTVAFFGDAAVEEGTFHESINFAVLHRLPVIFVCENNLYSVYAPLALRQPPREIYTMVKGHGIESYQCDGNDVRAVYDLAKKAVEKAHRGLGPVFIECKTYRWREHCGPGNDNELGYRTEAEYNAWIERCPIKLLQDYLMVEHLITENEIVDIRNAINQEIDGAVNFAKQSPFPEPQELLQHIYAGD